MLLSFQPHSDVLGIPEARAAERIKPFFEQLKPSQHGLHLDLITQKANKAAHLTDMT